VADAERRAERLTLQNPKDRSGITRLTIERVQVDMSLSSAWSGHPKISEIVVTHPVLTLPKCCAIGCRMPMHREGACIGHGRRDHRPFRITDGEVAFSRVRDRIDSHITAITPTPSWAATA